MSFYRHNYCRVNFNLGGAFKNWLKAIVRLKAIFVFPTQYDNTRLYVKQQYNAILRMLGNNCVVKQYSDE